MTAQAQRRRERSLPSAGGVVHLHIDHLLLQGAAPGEARRLTDALEAELSYLAAQPGARFVPFVAEHLPTARFTAGRAPEQTGRSVASSLWSGIAEASTNPCGSGNPNSSNDSNSRSNPGSRNNQGRQQ